MKIYEFFNSPGTYFVETSDEKLSEEAASCECAREIGCSAKVLAEVEALGLSGIVTDAENYADYLAYIGVNGDEFFSRLFAKIAA